LTRVILTADHRQIRAGEIGIDYRRRGRVNKIDIAGKQCLHGSGAGTNEEQFHIDAMFLIEPAVLANPENGEGAGERSIGDAKFLRV
jgi:hypothetical protein